MAPGGFSTPSRVCPKPQSGGAVSEGLRGEAAFQRPDPRMPSAHGEIREYLTPIFGCGFVFLGNQAEWEYDTMAKSFDDANVVTRVKVRDTEDGAVIGLFHKRSKLFEFDAEDASRDGWEDDIDAFLIAKPRTDKDVEAFLTSEGGDEEEDEGEGGSIVPNKYRIKYGVTQRCGDEIAEALSAFVTLPRAGKKDIDGGLDRSRLRAVAETNGLADKLADYEHRELNGGLLRMNISNILRGMHRRGEQVVIGDHTWPAREVEKKARKRTAKKEVAAK